MFSRSCNMKSLMHRNFSGAVVRSSEPIAEWPLYISTAVQIHGSPCSAKMAIGLMETKSLPNSNNCYEDSSSARFEIHAYDIETLSKKRRRLAALLMLVIALFGPYLWAQRGRYLSLRAGASSISSLVRYDNQAQTSTRSSVSSHPASMSTLDFA